MSFIHLHTHSHYSLLEGLPKPRDYIKKAAELGMSAVALTDTANIHGAFELYKYGKEYGINALIGAEIYTESLLPGVKHHKLVLLAKSNRGYKNLIEIVSWGHVQGLQNGIPIVSFEILKQFSGDLICLSGPMSGEISYSILTGKSNQDIIERVAWYQSTFGKDSYFLELLIHSDIPKQDLVTQRLIELHNNYSLPVVAANNTYYLNGEDKASQDVIVALGTGHQVDNPDRPTFINGDYSFFSQVEAEKLFGFIPSSLENTQKIADSIHIKIETGKSLMPKFELIGEDKTLYEEFLQETKNDTSLRVLHSDEFFLRYVCFSGVNWRFKSDFSKNEVFELVKKKESVGLTKPLHETQPDELKTLSPQYYTGKKRDFLEKLSIESKEMIDRLEYELFVVHEMGFDAYFLIVSDYIGWARKNDIPVGPGRGSAAGSLLAYLTGITDLDPIKFDLIFERFLNPARVSMPDIDTDFSDDGRDLVVEYCRERYGRDRVMQICTFGTFAARAAFKDVGRVQGVSFSEMNEAAKHIPEKPGTKLAGALEVSSEFKQLYETSTTYASIIDSALKIEGNVRQIGVHACAVIIAPDDMKNYTALQHPPKDSDVIITQYDAKPLEDIGLLKMDFLGLRNLTIIQRTLKIIKEQKGVDINILDIPLDDERVFHVFSVGDTTGVFQFESSGMRNWLRVLKPTDINDIIAMVSLYRPGPMQFIQYYIDRKYGREKVEYMYEDLARILEKKYGKETVQEERKKLFEDLGSFMDITYGISVYQEQLMRIVQAMAGFSLAEADMLRRGVGKKKKDIVEKIKIDFTKKAADFRDYKPETSDYIYEKMIMPASDYSFNKSHAACYALIAYQTAYLKALYPTEFMTSLLTSDEEDTDRISFEVEEIQQRGIEIMAPSIHTSLKHFTYIDDTHIQFGLTAIKGLGDGPIDAIIMARSALVGKKFSSLEEFISLTGKEVINKKSLESLIKSGSLDDLGDRSQLLGGIDAMLRFSRQKDQKIETSQMGIFDFSDQKIDEVLILDPVEKISFETLLFSEKEVLGFMVSGHPFDGMKSYISNRTSGVHYLRMSLDTLRENLEKALVLRGSDLSKKTEEAIKEAKEEKRKKFLETLRVPCKCIGIIVDVRKILTKTGKSMMFLSCEAFDFDFEVTLHDKEVQTFSKEVVIGKVVIVEEGFTQIDPQVGRKTVVSRGGKFRFVSLSQIREQALDMKLLGPEKRRKLPSEFLLDNVDKTLSSPTSSTFIVSENSEEDIPGEDSVNQEIEASTLLQETPQGEEVSRQELKTEEYIILIPPSTRKAFLLELKDFLIQEKKGSIQIYIELKGQKIDTKIAISSLQNLQSWISTNKQEN